MPEPLIDSSLLGELLSDGGAEAGLAELFITQSQVRLRELEEAIDAGDAGAVARVAHNLKGACATFGARRMAACAGRLCGAPGADLVAAATRLRPELRTVLADTVHAVNAAATAARPERTPKLHAKPRLLIADDEPVVRGVVAAHTRQHFTLVGEASDADGALELARALRPDVVLLDVEMPGGGLYATEQLHAELPEILIVMLSTDRQRSSVLRFLQAGAAAYLRKGTSIADLGARLIALLEQSRAGSAHHEWSRPPVDDRVRAVLDQGDLGVAVVALEGRDAGRVTVANAAYADLLGRLPGDLVGASIESWTHPDDLPEGMDHPLVALAAGQSERVSFRTRYVHRSEAVLRVSVWAVSHRGPDGERVAIMQVPAPTHG